MITQTKNTLESCQIPSPSVPLPHPFSLSCVMCHLSGWKQPPHRLGSRLASLFRHQELSHPFRCRIRSGTCRQTLPKHPQPSGYWKDRKPAEQLARLGSTKAPRNTSNRPEFVTGWVNTKALKKIVINNPLFGFYSCREKAINWNSKKGLTYWNSLSFNDLWILLNSWVSSCVNVEIKNPLIKCCGTPTHYKHACCRPILSFFPMPQWACRQVTHSAVRRARRVQLGRLSTWTCFCVCMWHIGRIRRETEKKTKTKRGCTTVCMNFAMFLLLCLWG